MLVGAEREIVEGWRDTWGEGQTDGEKEKEISRADARGSPLKA